MTAAARVACVGECMVELIERRDGTFARAFGGDTLNTAVYLARAGVGVDYATALGDDPFSMEMLAAWRHEGVGTDLVLQVPGALPGLYVIQTDPLGERRFSYWRDSAPARRLFSLPDSARIAAALPGYDVVYLSGITLSLYANDDRSRLFAAVDAARARGARIAFDTNFRPRGWPDLAACRTAYQAMLGRTDIVFAGADDLSPLFGFDERAAWSFLRAAGPPETILKLPSFACRLCAGGIEDVVASVHVGAVVDTTAAGDSFAAGYLAARLAGQTIHDAALAAHRLASLVISHPGAIIAPDAATRTVRTDGLPTLSRAGSVG